VVHGFCWPLTRTSPLPAMLSSIPISALIVSLAIGYLVVVYSLLWWAKRTGKADKRTII
jgi:hypothetical protein